MSVRQMLSELQNHGFSISILTATVFDSNNGTTKLAPHLDVIEKNRGKIINIDDELDLKHKIYVTENFDGDKITRTEIDTFLSSFRNTLVTYRPDLVFNYGGGVVALMTTYEAKMTGIPTVSYTPNGSYEQARWCKDVDLVVTDSQATANLYASQGLFAPKPVGKFIPKALVVAQERNPKYLTFINPTRAKGGAIVAMIAILLQDRGSAIKIEVVESRGAWSTILKEVLDTLGRADEELSNVVVTPNQSDMKPIYARSKAVLAPSVWWESGARVLVEATLNGIPTITTRRGGNAEMVDETGIIFELPAICYEPPFLEIPSLETLEPVVERIERLFADQEYYNYLSEKSMRVGKNNHDIKVSTLRLVSAIKPLTDKYAGDDDTFLNRQKNHLHNLNEAGAYHIKSQKSKRVTFIDVDPGDYRSCLKFKIVNNNTECITIHSRPNFNDNSFEIKSIKKIDARRIYSEESPSQYCSYDLKLLAQKIIEVTDTPENVVVKLMVHAWKSDLVETLENCGLFKSCEYLFVEILNDAHKSLSGLSKWKITVIHGCKIALWDAKSYSRKKLGDKEMQNALSGCFE